MKHRLSLPAILIGLVIFLAGCATTARSIVQTPTPTVAPTPAATATPATCQGQAGEFLTTAKSLYEAWRDAAEIASHTSRLALGPVIARLQELRREWRAVPAPACAQSVHTAMDAYMTRMIDGYLAFMGQESVAVLKLRLAKSSLSDVHTAYVLAELPAPFALSNVPKLDLGQP